MTKVTRINQTSKFEQKNIVDQTCKVY